MPAPASDRYRNLWSEEERRRLAPILARFVRGLGALPQAVKRRVEILEVTEKRRQETRARWIEQHGLLRVPADATTVVAWLAEVYARKARLARHPKRGRVLVATAPIEVTEIVLVEPPLLISTPPQAKTKDAEQILGSLAGRWRLLRALDSVGPAALALIRDLYNAHVDSIPSYARRVKAAREARLEGLPELSDDEVAKLLGIVESNAHARRSHPEWNESCIQPGVAMMAHSCDPNTTVFFGDTLTFVHARRAIQEGEELTSAYVSQSVPVLERMARLVYKFGFICECPLCSTVSHSDLEEGLRWLAANSAEPDAESLHCDAEDRRETPARWVTARSVVETVLSRRIQETEG